MSRAFIESDHSKHCLFVWFAVKKFSPTEILMFVVSFFGAFCETVCQCLEVLAVAVAVVAAAAAVVWVHMCVAVIAPLHSGRNKTQRKQTPQESHTSTGRGKFSKPERGGAFIRPLLLPGITRWCQESSRCSADGREERRREGRRV